MHLVHIAKRFLSLLGYTALVFLLLIAYGNLPNRWYHVLAVSSGSMSPTFNAGDMIVITPAPETLEPGMILTLQVNGELVTHRLIEVSPDGAIVTQGDANPVPDSWAEGTEIIIIGLYRGRIPYLGYIANLPGRLVRMVQTGAWFTDTDTISMDIGSVVLTPIPSPTSETKPKGTSIEANLTVVGAQNIGVSGEVCVTNKGEVVTQGLTLIEQVEYKPKKGSFQPLTGASTAILPDQPLQPGEQRCYPYTISFAPVDSEKYRIVAHVTITNHSGWLPGGPHCVGPDVCPFGPDLKAEFDLSIAQPKKPDVLLDVLPTITETPERTPPPIPVDATPTPQSSDETGTPAPTLENITDTPVPPDPTEEHTPDPTTSTPDLSTLEPTSVTPTETFTPAPEEPTVTDTLEPSPDTVPPTLESDVTVTP